MAERERESETRDTVFAVQKRKTQWKRQGQGNSWISMEILPQQLHLSKPIEAKASAQSGLVK